MKYDQGYGGGNLDRVHSVEQDRFDCVWFLSFSLSLHLQLFSSNSGESLFNSGIFSCL